MAGQWGAQSIQIDAAGGWGKGPIAILRQENYSVLDILGGGKPFDPKFADKNAEMYWTACEHLKGEASLPAEGCEDLVLELSSRTYGYKNDKILLEPKKLLKARIGRSPDLADALAYTHAFPVAATRDVRAALFPFDMAGDVSKSRTEYDPLERA